MNQFVRWKELCLIYRGSENGIVNFDIEELDFIEEDVVEVELETK